MVFLAIYLIGIPLHAWLVHRVQMSTTHPAPLLDRVWRNALVTAPWPLVVVGVFICGGYKEIKETYR